MVRRKSISIHVSRSTLADANETRDWRIYADFAQGLIRTARALCINEPLAVGLVNTVYALDATIIDLCSAAWPPVSANPRPSRRPLGSSPSSSIDQQRACCREHSARNLPGARSDRNERQPEQWRTDIDAKIPCGASLAHEQCPPGFELRVRLTVGVSCARPRATAGRRC